MANKHRGRNEGSIYQKPNGTWRAQITLEGHRLSFTAKTRRECQEWIKKTGRQVDDGLNLAGTRINVQEFLGTWLASSRHIKKATTWEHYHQLARMYVTPRIGAFKLKDLRPDQIQQLYDGLLSEGVGTYTVIKIHTMLHSALVHAVRTGLATRNAAGLTMPPKPPAKEMQVLDESQVSLMLLAARGIRLEALLQLAVATGMRQMELLGLKWTDLDWLKGTIKIERQLLRARGSTPQFSSTKTRFSKRTIDLGPKTLDVLRRHADQQHAERKVLGEKWQDFGLIFPNHLGGPYQYHNLLRDFKQLLKNAGLPEIRFHDLRHTAASLMLNHGIPVLVVSRRLGHAKPSITLDVYGHLISSMQTEVAVTIDDLITPIELHPIAPDLHPLMVGQEQDPHI